MGGTCILVGRDGIVGALRVPLAGDQPSKHVAQVRRAILYAVGDNRGPVFKKYGVFRS